jgi:hypothetical protein
MIGKKERAWLATSSLSRFFPSFSELQFPGTAKIWKPPQQAPSDGYEHYRAL